MQECCLVSRDMRLLFSFIARNAQHRGRGTGQNVNMIEFVISETRRARRLSNMRSIRVGDVQTLPPQNAACKICKTPYRACAAPNIQLKYKCKVSAFYIYIYIYNSGPAL